MVRCIEGWGDRARVAAVRAEGDVVRRGQRGADGGGDCCPGRMSVAGVVNGLKWVGARVRAG